MFKNITKKIIRWSHADKTNHILYRRTRTHIIYIFTHIFIHEIEYTAHARGREGEAALVRVRIYIRLYIIIVIIIKKFTK